MEKKKKKTVKKIDLENLIYENSGIRQRKEINIFTKYFIDSFKVFLTHGYRIEIRGLGTFEINKKTRKNGVNDPKIIFYCRFKLSKNIRDSLKQFENYRYKDFLLGK